MSEFDRVASAEWQAEEWRLCLLAEGISSRLERTDEGLGWRLVVDEAHAANAALIVDQYEAEQRERRAALAVPAPVEQVSRLGLYAVIVFVALHAASYLDRGTWLALGRADADAIRHGELWRATTALFLHGDAMHVFSNSVAALVLFTALGRMLGTGQAALLLVVSGTLGNLANAFVHDPGFASIGASTATFSAIGLLAVLQWAQPSGRRVRRWWPPLAAALGLFAMLGTAKETDVLAHLFGLIAGMVVGAGLIVRRRFGTRRT